MIFHTIADSEIILLSFNLDIFSSEYDGVVWSLILHSVSYTSSLSSSNPLTVFYFYIGHHEASMIKDGHRKSGH